MKSSRPTSFLAFALMILGSLPAAADGAPPILDQVLKAYGGKAARERAATLRETGTVVATIRGGKGTIVRTFERPARLRVDVNYGAAHGTEIRILDRSRGWRSGIPVEGPMLTSMILQAARLDLPWILEEHAEAIVDQGLVQREEGRRHVLELPLAGSMSLVVEIDPDTGRITRSIGRAHASGFPGGVMEFATDYADFRMIDGLLVPFREENYAMGHNTGETLLTEVEVGVAVSSSTFKP